MTRVHVLGTGGTIASRSGSSGRSASVRAEELVRSVGGLPPGIEVESRDLVTEASFAFGTSDLLSIGREVRRCLTEDADGVVITHGTDVMEETAFLLDLVHATSRPVVLTGAQRPFDHVAPDGPANLRDAIEVAASPSARDHGVLIVFDGYGFPARGVTKVDTQASHAFDAPGRGPSLRIADRVQELARPRRPAALALDLERDALPRVDVVPAYTGADGTQLRAALAAGAAGIVVASLGSGNVGPLLLEAVTEAIGGGVPVLVCSRVPAGPAVPLYAGGGAALERAGAVFGSDLSPWQGRLLLAAACAVDPGDPAAAVRAWLEE